MKPEVTVCLKELARTLAEDFAPKLPTSFEQGAARRWAMLAQAATEEFDRAAARRVEENDAIRKILQHACALVADSILRDRLRTASEAKETSFRVSNLDRRNRELRTLLCDLHVYVEGLPGAEARALEDAIWEELTISTERRSLSIGRF